MTVYFITGKLGAGKTLGAVGRIGEYLQRNSRVATNLDLYPERFHKKKTRNCSITRLPDKPSASHMFQLGNGYEGDLNEENNGLIVLDECGTWFNSRTWNDPDRKELIDWFLHARKLRWDIIFIVQDISIVDKQARQTLCEHLVIVRRLDRVSIPFFSFFFKLFGMRLTFPKIHVCKVRYGDSEVSPVVDRWFYRGKNLYDIYDTEQVFIASDQGNYSMLTPWHLVGRYLSRKRFIDYANQYLLPLVKLILYPYAYYCSSIVRSVPRRGQTV